MDNIKSNETAKIARADVNMYEGYDPQKEHLWGHAIANSIDIIRDFADQALADREAGRTKKINS